MKTGTLLSTNPLQQVQAQNTNLTGQNESVNPSVTYLINKIKSPKNKERIDKAIHLEKRIRLHTVGTQDYSTHFDEWLFKIKKLLPSDKYEIFVQLIGEPVPTLDLTETIFDELAKIFEASNKSIYSSYQKDSSKYSEQFKNYFDHDHFFRSEVYEQLKVAPNSFLIIDTKLELDEQGRQQPIAYFAHLDSIRDVDVNRDGSVNYILFQSGDNRIVGIDATNYYVFDTEQKEPQLIEGYPRAHGLTDYLGRPFTPAFMLYPDFLNVSDNILVNSPLTKSLGNLDWLLFWSVSKRYLDLYAPFPIYVSYEEDCSYVLPTGEACDNGYISIISDDPESPASKIPCPHCSKTKMFGAGSEVTVPAPQSKDDPNLIDAIKVIPAESKSIEYVTKEEQRLKQEIYYSVLGKTSTPLENFSQSVTQLDLSTESRKAVLIHVKAIFEKLHKKVLYTMNRLMYADEFIDCHVSYGDNYFLLTQDQEADRYKKLKDTGAPESMLHASLESIISTSYKTSPHTALLQQVYLEVEPYQTQSLETVMKLASQGLVPRKKLISKIHFTDFIEEYEAQHQTAISMIETGNADKNKLVKMMKDQLDKFAQKIIETIDTQPLSPMQKKEEERYQQSQQSAPDLAKPSSVQKREYRAGDKEVD
jgi:hypothetical protein